MNLARASLKQKRYFLTNFDNVPKWSLWIKINYSPAEWFWPIRVEKLTEIQSFIIFWRKITKTRNEINLNKYSEPVKRLVEKINTANPKRTTN